MCVLYCDPCRLTLPLMMCTLCLGIPVSGWGAWLLAAGNVSMSASRLPVRGSDYSALVTAVWPCGVQSASSYASGSC
jgi:hypothetical protein